MFKKGCALFLGLLLSGYGANALADEGGDSISQVLVEDGIAQIP